MAAFGGWMPLDGRQATLLVVVVLLVLMLVSLLH